MKVYIHAARLNHWQAILTEIIELIRLSSLDMAADSIEVNFAGDGPEFPLPEKYTHTVSPLNLFEFSTLDRLWESAQRKESETYFYLHLKGVTKPFSTYDYHWRRELTDFTILGWRDRVLHLEERNTTGPRYCIGGSGHSGQWSNAHAHYSGNFWWARADYLRKLPRPSSISEGYTNRYGAEAWIGTNEGINQLVTQATT